MLGQTVDSHDTKMLSAMLADSASSILSEGNIVFIYVFINTFCSSRQHDNGYHQHNSQFL